MTVAPNSTVENPLPNRVQTAGFYQPAKLIDGNLKD